MPKVVKRVTEMLCRVEACPADNVLRHRGLSEFPESISNG
jgi:hypothetical protein